jgi:glycosyltransferase involved in cell wall biosynthesis
LTAGGEYTIAWVRILIIAGEAPLPPLNGYRLWLWHLTRSLARRHEVCVVAFRAPDQHGEPPPGIELVTIDSPSDEAQARAVAYVTATATRTPSWVGPLTGPMRAAVRRMRAERSFDVAHVAGLQLLRAADALDGIPTVVVPLDAEHRNVEARADISRPPTSWMLGLQARFTRRFSARHLDRGPVVAVTDEDAEAMRELDPELEIDVIPNGVDADFFAPAPHAGREPGLLVFTGAMHWPPNVRAARVLAREILPRVRAEVPEARLAIVGRDPARAVVELGALDGVEVTGEVADIRTWLWRADVYVCPMVNGTGIKNKLLEALAAGSSAVATPLSVQGMRVRSHEQLLLACPSADFAAATVRLLRDPSLRTRLGRAARAYALEHHDWGRVADAYERVSHVAIAGAHATSGA